MQAIKVHHGPDPDPLLQPRTRSPSPDNRDGAAGGKGTKGKPWKAPKPSQGDFVLIDSLAGGNRPDLAAIAGEDPLVIDPPAEPEGLVVNDGMNEEEPDLNVVQIAQKVTEQIAQKATDTVSVTHRVDEAAKGSTKPYGQARTRPTINTILPDPGGAYRPHNCKNADREEEGLQDTISNSPRKRKFGTEMPPPTRSGLSATEKGVSRGLNEVGSTHCRNDRLPELSQFAIQASEGSPLETLPAMQNNAMNSLKCPQSHHNLPSIQEQLGGLADSPLSPESNSRSAGSVRQSRIPFQNPPGTGLPTPLDGTFQRPGSFSHVQVRSAVQYPQGFGGQPSPASTTMSESSPRDYHIKSDVMSPSSRYPPSHGSAPTPQSVDIPTPISAGDSYATYSSQTSPNGEQASPEDSHGPYLNGVPMSPTFKCDVPDCAAPPFQTQYLLK